MSEPKLIKRCGFAWGPFAPNLHSISPYIGCPFDCSYCWSKMMAHRFHREPLGGWRNVQVNPFFNTPNDHSYHHLYNEDRLKQEAVRIRDKGGTILIGATCDPYPPLEKSTNLTLDILADLSDMDDLRVLVLTKSPIACRDWELFKALDAQVGFTLTAPAGVDTSFWEPHAPSNASRIAALKFLHSKGVRTFVSIEPWLVVAKWTLKTGEWFMNITLPACIVKETARFVDYYIVGSWNVAGKPKKALVPYYKMALPGVIEALERLNPGAYWIKKELGGILDNPLLKGKGGGETR